MSIRFAVTIGLTCLVWTFRASAQDLTLEESQKVLRNQYAHYNFPAIHLAAILGDVDGIREALGYGAPIDLELREGAVGPQMIGVTPLMLACNFGRVDAVSALIDAGADVNRRAQSGLTPLMIAAGSVAVIGSDHAECMRLLLQAGAEIDAETASVTALHFAAGMPIPLLFLPLEVILFENRPPDPRRALSPKMGGAIGLPPVGPPRRRSSRYSHVARLRILLDAGADIGAGDQSILYHGAIAGADADQFELLLDAGLDPNMCLGRTADATPLLFALRRGSVAIVELLAARGARFARSGDAARFLLDEAVKARENAGAKLQLLLDNDVELQPSWRTPLLRMAANSSGPGTAADGSAIPILIEMGADATGLLVNGERALIVACDQWTATALAATLKFDRNVNEKSDRVWLPRPLMLAAGSYVDSVEKCRLLLDAGADLDAQDARYATAMIYAASAGNFDAVIALAEAGANPNLPERRPKRAGDHEDDARMTALMYVANRGTRYTRTDIESIARAARVLIDRGADVNARTSLGNTALTFALRSQNAPVAQMLRDAGAFAE